MIKKRKYFIGIALIILTITSCKYEKLLKSSDYVMKYNKALDYYYDGDYTRAQGIFEQIRPVFRASKQADTVYLYNAYCSYFLGDFILAAHYFDEFYRIFGNSPYAEEADFMSAYASYKMSRKPSLDQNETYSAINRLTLYITRYPYSDKVPECMEIVEEMKDKLVEKSYISAKLYFNMDQYKPAIIALNNSLNEFPDTKYREEIMFMILRSNFLYAEMSIPTKQRERYQATVDEYYSFINEYPESRYQKDVQDMYEKSQNYLKN